MLSQLHKLKLSKFM